jgi:hypothetical protein
LAEKKPDVRWVAPALSFVTPYALFLVLNFLRPDLMQPMLDHVYGFMLVRLTVLFSTLGAVLAGLANYAVKAPWARVLLGLASVFLGTLPALFLVAFGPIVFAFMFGGGPP